MSNRYHPPADQAQRAAAVHVSTVDGGHLPPAANQSLSTPTDGDLASMEALGIRHENGAFHFAGYRYSRLTDALNDARRVQANGPGPEVWHWVLK